MIVIMKRRNFTFLIVTFGLLLVLAGFYSFASHPDLNQWRQKGIVISQVSTTHKAIALTLDDGPNPEATLQILEILKQNDAKATFFVLGLHAQDFPHLIKAIQIGGHEIGNHGFSHNIKAYNNISFAKSDIKQSEEAIIRITGTRPRLLRPPGGFLSRDLIKYCLEEELQVITWTWQADYKDWKSANSSALAGQIVKGVQPGQIILLHDGGQNRQVLIKALTLALPELSELGYKFVTVSELLTLQDKSQ
ncbi:MAG: polysaccharide deacetylase family protein [Syntrophomonadaceae bacterium]|nr:polysaccharide deacetylase family protein [Syntrophomonadaceae bacterium]